MIIVTFHFVVTFFFVALRIAMDAPLRKWIMSAEIEHRDRDCCRAAGRHSGSGHLPTAGSKYSGPRQHSTGVRQERSYHPGADHSSLSRRNTTLTGGTMSIIVSQALDYI